MFAPIAANLVTLAGAMAAIAINALWEGALLTMTVWLLLKMWPRLNASTRYLVWSATLVAVAVVPVATTLPFLTTAPPPMTSMAATGPAVGATMVTHAPTAVPNHAGVSPAVRPEQAPVQAPATRPAWVSPERFRMALPLPLALGVFGLWAALALLAFLRLAIGLHRLEQLKRDALPLPVEYRDAMLRWTQANKGSRQVRLCVSDDIDVPVAVGLFDSMILIPRALLERLSEAEVDQISLHELAHLRRADDWSNGMQRVLMALFVWNPAVMFIGQQLDLEREVACDDWVLGLTGSVRPYALCLTKMAETSSWPRATIPAPGVFATRKHISLRIERLLGAGRNIATSLSIAPAAAAVAVVGALAFAMTLVAPSIAAPIAQTAQSTAAQVGGEIPASKHVYERIVVTSDAHQKVALPPLPANAVAGPAPAPSTSSSAMPSTIHVPAVDVHVPAHHVDMPAVDLHIPAITMHVPSPMPPAAIAEARKAMAAAHAVQSLSPLAASSVKMGLSIAQAMSTSTVTSTTTALRVAQASSMQDCNACDFAGVNWSGRDMHGVSYVGVDLSRANLQNANFSGGSFNGTDFSGANLRGARFTHANLTGCDFTHADLTGADFTGAKLSGCQFSGATMTSSEMRAVLNTCSGCDFSHANLAGQNLSGIRANGVDLSGANLSGANLAGSQFMGVDFSHARLDNANLNGTVFNGCDLHGVDLSHVDLSKAKLIGIDLSERDKEPKEKGQP